MASGVKTSEAKGFEQLFHPDTLKPSSLVELENQVKQRKDSRPASAPASTETSPGSGMLFRVPKEMLDMSWYAGLVFGQEVGRTNVVLGVAQDSPASRAQVVSHTLNTVWMGGIRMGDVLIRVGNKPVSGKLRVLEVWQALKDEGEAAESRGMLLTFQRAAGGGSGGDPLEYTVCVVTRPTSFAPSSPSRSAQRSLDDRLLLEKHPAVSDAKSGPVPPVSHFTSASLVHPPATSPPSDASAASFSPARTSTDLSPPRVRLGTSLAESGGNAAAGSSPVRSPGAQETVAEEAAIKSLVRQVSEANRERREESRRLGKAVEELHASRLETEAKVKAAHANSLTIQRERDELLRLATEAVQYSEELEAAAASHQAQAAYHAAIVFQAKQRVSGLERDLLDCRRQLAEAGVYDARFAASGANQSRAGTLAMSSSNNSPADGRAGRGSDGDKEALEKLVRRYEREVEEMLVEVEEARSAGERLREYTRMLEEQLETRGQSEIIEERERREEQEARWEEAERREEQRRREWEEERSALQGRIVELQDLLQKMREQRESLQQVIQLEESVVKQRQEQEARLSAGQAGSGASGAPSELEGEVARLQQEVRRLEHDAQERGLALAAAKAEATEQERMQRVLAEELRESVGGKDALLGEALALAETLSVRIRESPRERVTPREMNLKEAARGGEEVERWQVRVREQEDAIARLKEDVRKEGEKRERMVKSMEGIAKEQMKQLASAEAEAQERLRAEVTSLEGRNQQLSRQVDSLSGKLAAVEQEAKSLRERAEQMSERSEQLEQEKRAGEEASRAVAEKALRATTEELQHKKKVETDALTQQLQKQKESNGMLRSELETSVLRMQEERSRHRAREVEIGNELNAQVQALTAQLEERTAEVETLQGTLAASATTKEREEEHRVKATRVEAELSAQVQSLLAQVDAKQRQLDSIQSAPSAPAPIPTLAYQPKPQPFQLFDDLPEPPTRPPVLAAPPPARLQTSFPPRSPRALAFPSPRREAASEPAPTKAQEEKELSHAQRELARARAEVSVLQAQLAVALRGAVNRAPPQTQQASDAYGLEVLAPGLGLVLVAGASAASTAAMAGCAVDILGRGVVSPCMVSVRSQQLVVPTLLCSSLLCTATGEVSTDTMLSAIGGMVGLGMAGRALALLGEGETAENEWWMQAVQSLTAALPLFTVVGQTNTRELWLGGLSIAVTLIMAWEALELLMPGEAANAMWALGCLGWAGLSLVLGSGWRVIVAMSWSVRLLGGTAAVTLAIAASGAGEAAPMMVSGLGGSTGLVMAGRAVWLLGDKSERQSVEGVVVAAQCVLLSVLLLGPNNVATTLRQVAESAAGASVIAAAAAPALLLLWLYLDLGPQAFGLEAAAALSTAVKESRSPAVLLPACTALIGLSALAFGRGPGREMIGSAGGMTAVAMAERAWTLLGAEGEGEAGWWGLGLQVSMLAVPLLSMAGAEQAGRMGRVFEKGLWVAGSIGVTSGMVWRSAELLMPGQASEALLILMGWTLGLPVALVLAPTQVLLDAALLSLALPLTVSVVLFAMAVTLVAAAMRRPDEPVAVLLSSLGGASAVAMAAWALRLLGAEGGGAEGRYELLAAALQAVALLPAVAVAPRVLACAAMASTALSAWMVACAHERLGGDSTLKLWCDDEAMQAWTSSSVGPVPNQLPTAIAILVFGAMLREQEALSAGAGALSVLMVLTALSLLGEGAEGAALDSWISAAAGVVAVSPILPVVRALISPTLLLALVLGVGGWCSAELVLVGRESTSCAAVMAGHLAVTAAASVAAGLASTRTEQDVGQMECVGLVGGVVALSMAREALELLDDSHTAASWLRG